MESDQARKRRIIGQLISETEQRIINHQDQILQHTLELAADEGALVQWIVLLKENAVKEREKEKE